YGGFETLSLLQPFVERYLHHAYISETVYVLRQNHWQPPRHPNMRYISLTPGSRLTHDTFLIADCSNHHAALVAMHEAAVNEEKTEERKFKVIKSSNPAVVTQLALALEAMIDQSLVV